MAVEPCWHKWIIGGQRREYEHFDAAYSGGSALGQSFAFVDRSSSGGSAPIAAIPRRLLPNRGDFPYEEANHCWQARKWLRRREPPNGKDSRDGERRLPERTPILRCCRWAVAPAHRHGRRFLRLRAGGPYALNCLRYDVSGTHLSSRPNGPPNFVRPSSVLC